MRYVVQFSVLSFFLSLHLTLLCREKKRKAAAAEAEQAVVEEDLPTQKPAGAPKKARQDAKKGKK